MSDNNLLTPANFVVRDKLLDSGYFTMILGLVIQFVNARDANGEFLFIDRIMIPIVKQVFTEGETRPPPDAELRMTARAMFQDHVITLLASGCDDDCYGQYVPNRKRILMNEDWMTRANIAFQDITALDQVENAADVLRQECELHVVGGFAKVLHELMHSFTAKILEYEAAVKVKLAEAATTPSTANTTTSAEEIVPFTVTPTKVGIRFKIEPQGVIGDMGCALPDLLFGHGLRFKFRYEPTIWTPLSIYFERCTVVTKDSTVQRKTFSFPNRVNEFNLVRRIILAFRNYCTTATPETSADLYNSFHVDETQLKETGKSDVRKFPIEKSKKRKRAELSWDTFAEESEVFFEIY